MKMLSKVNNNVPFPVKKVNRIDGIRYRAIIDMKDGTERDFSFTELERLSKLWNSFKKQTGFKEI